jgi:hypothetical protein
VKLTFKPVTLDRWADFEALFGDRGLSVRLLEAAVE